MIKKYTLGFLLILSSCSFEATRKAIGGTGGDSETNRPIDVTAPMLAGAVSDGEYNNSLVQSPLLTWVAGSDSDSGIATYQIAVGTSLGLTDVLNWTDVGVVTSYTLTGLSLSDGSTYYPSVRLVDVAGNVSPAVLGDGWIVDANAPTNITATHVSIWFSPTESPVASWTASTDIGSGVSHYLFAIGTSLGGSDVFPWTNIGTVLTYSAADLSLLLGNSYYISVKAVDSAGNESSISGGQSWVYSEAKYIVDPTAITNNDDADTNDFICADSVGKCSLAAAIQQQAWIPFDFTIEIPSGNYVFLSGIDIIKYDTSKTVTLQGAGVSNTVLDGNNLSRIMRIITTSPVVFKDIKFINGTANASMTDDGGALSAWLEIINVDIENCYFENNRAKGYGAALSFRWGGSVMIKDSIFYNNSNIAGGVPTSSVLSGGDLIEIENSYFYGNSGNPVIYSADITESFTIRNSSIVNNTAIGLSLTFYPVTAGKTSLIENTTIARNTGTALQIIGYSDYGVESHDFVIRNSTISENKYGGAGAVQLSVNWSNLTTGTFKIMNSILSLANPATQKNCISLSGVTEVYNSLIETGTGACAWTSSSGMLTAAPQLNSLASNGGIGLSMLPLITSPVINSGSNVLCSATDQVGVIRPIGGTCDMGALETNY